MKIIGLKENKPEIYGMWNSIPNHSCNIARKAHLYFFENKFVQGCFGFGNEGLIDISNIL